MELLSLLFRKRVRLFNFEVEIYDHSKKKY